MLRWEKKEDEEEERLQKRWRAGLLEPAERDEDEQKLELFTISSGSGGSFILPRVQLLAWRPLSRSDRRPLGSTSGVTVPKDEVVGDVSWVTAYKLVEVFGSDSLALDPNPATQAEESHGAFLNTNMAAAGRALRSRSAFQIQ